MVAACSRLKPPLVIADLFLLDFTQRALLNLNVIAHTGMAVCVTGLLSVIQALIRADAQTSQASFVNFVCTAFETQQKLLQLRRKQSDHVLLVSGVQFVLRCVKDLYVLKLPCLLSRTSSCNLLLLRRLAVWLCFYETQLQVVLLSGVVVSWFAVWCAVQYGSLWACENAQGYSC